MRKKTTVLREGPRSPRILVFDIETAPLKAFVWKIWEENVGLNQIVSDWHLLAWAAKWLDEKPILYRDQREEKNVENDRKILEGLWRLLDEADVVVTQNGKKFDQRKVNARFAIHGLGPPSPYKHIDTRELAKRHFDFTSTSLEYLSDKLCKSHRKEKSRKFVGFELWSECLKGNLEAWREMEKYNKADVLATEELYRKLAPWGTSVDLNAFHGDLAFRCHCGSLDLERRGFAYTAAGKYQRFVCRSCGAWTNSRGAAHNLLPKEKRAALKGPR